MPYSYPWQGVKDPLAIPSGAMRQNIQIQAQSTTQDSFGQEVATWTTILSCWSAIETVAMRERFQGAFVSQVTHRITIRWPGASIAILASQRVLLGASVYQIQAVENVQQRNRILHLMCLEIDSAQVGG